MRGEGRAAHTHDTGILHDLDHFLHRQSVGIGRSLHLFADRVLEIVFDHNGHHVAAHREGPGLDGLHRTGNAGMDRGAQPLEFADFLTHLYLVAYFYDRGAGCAKVHRHGDDHGSRGCQLLDGLFIGCGLHIMGMNAAKESLCHCLHLILTPLIGVKAYPAPPSGNGMAGHASAHYHILRFILHHPSKNVQTMNSFFCIKFINFFVFLHFFPVFAQAHPLFLVNLHIFLPTTPAVAVPPLPLLSFFRRYAMMKHIFQKVSPQPGLPAGTANGGPFL